MGTVHLWRRPPTRASRLGYYFLGPLCKGGRRFLRRGRGARTATQLAEIEALFDAMIEADGRGPERALEKRVDGELDLYRAVTEASGNPYYTEVVAMIEGNIQSNLRSAFLKNAAASEFGPAIIDEHRAVIDALRAGDAEAARMATRTRFERAAERLAAREDFA